MIAVGIAYDLEALLSPALTGLLLVFRKRPV